MSREERYKVALERIQHGCFNYSHIQIKQFVDEALTEPPEFEEVEVVRWVAINKYGAEVGCWQNKAKAEAYAHGGTVIKLCNTYQRPVKPKVKRRVCLGTVNMFTGSEAMRHKVKTGIPEGAKLMAEWEE